MICIVHAFRLILLLKCLALLDTHFTLSRYLMECHNSF
uniref:Uncharacterized protein n=1 Tax=Anguilla anguilla TaxID=7936 RepID=A0A0E9Q095_ANGAN